VSVSNIFRVGSDSWMRLPCRRKRRKSYEHVGQFALVLGTERERGWRRPGVSALSHVRIYYTWLCVTTSKCMQSSSSSSKTSTSQQ
jgi:hypothetical protein